MQTLTDFDALWDYSNPVETEQRFRKLLPGPHDRGWRAELFSQIARTLGLQRRFDEAYQFLDRAEALIDESLPRARVRCLLERGRVLNTSGDPASSRALFQLAAELAREAGLDFYGVDALHMLGIVDAPERKLVWNERAIQAAEASPDPKTRAWAASLYNNYGWSKMDLGRFEEALEAFRRASDFREAQGKPDEIRIARWCVGRALRALGRLEEALEIQQALLAEWEREGREDGYVSEELGELFLELGRPDQARAHFRAAYGLLSQDTWLAEQEPARLARLKLLMEE
jgi:tetratricopeptide (TPR) repeat protein